MREKEELLERQELERFEKKGESKKRRRNRNRYSETLEVSFVSKHKISLVVAIAFISLAVGIAFYIK